MFLDEIGKLLFSQEDKDNNKASIIYGTALANSSGGEVLVKIDNSIYNYADEDFSEYQIVDFIEDDDDTAHLTSDEEEADLVWWEEDDDEAVEDEEAEVIEENE